MCASAAEWSSRIGKRLHAPHPGGELRTERRIELERRMALLRAQRQRKERIDGEIGAPTAPTRKSFPPR